jgi:aspartate racemase
MKKIGLVGGMGWESTAIYYRTINQLINRARGGQCTARLQLA